MSSKDTRVRIPKTKISMTILEFGEPLFAQFPEVPPIDVLRKLLKIVITVWNAHALAMPIWGEPHHLDNMKQLVGGPGIPPTASCCRGDAALPRSAWRERAHSKP